MCAKAGRHRCQVKVDIQACGLSEDVADLRFELGMKSSVVEAELVLKPLLLRILVAILPYSINQNAN